MHRNPPKPPAQDRHHLRDGCYDIECGRRIRLASLGVLFAIACFAVTLLTIQSLSWPPDWLGGTFLGVLLVVLAWGASRAWQRARAGADLIRYGIWRLRQGGYQVRSAWDGVWVRDPRDAVERWRRI